MVNSASPPHFSHNSLSMFYNQTDLNKNPSNEVKPYRQPSRRRCAMGHCGMDGFSFPIMRGMTESLFSPTSFPMDADTRGASGPTARHYRTG
ncbi:hypothetical protein SXCC_03973 [Gluconacetobacter sp. SXCC-1]|nr:hypothetical protein SXCC_03973 [Gluconacetobacter sp. SXCC-1]